MTDFRLALRRLARTPLFTIVAILTLALGIGANSAIFSVIDATLIKPLPYPNEGHVLFIEMRYPNGDGGSLSPTDFIEMRRESRAFDAVAGYREWSFNVRTAGEPQRVDGVIVTADFFRVLGVAPELGRIPDALGPDLLKQDEVVISDGFWRSDLGGRADVLGSTLSISGEPTVIVGVMPPGFDEPVGTRIWRASAYVVPANPLHPGVDPSGYSDSHWFETIARVRASLTVDAAVADAGAVARRIGEKNTEQDQRFTGVVLTTLHQDRVGDSRMPLYVLLGASGVLLLIACVNLANLQLARAAAHARDRVVRAALGAGRWRLAREQLVESLLLAIAGGLAGLFVASWGVASLRAFAPAAIRSLIDPSPDLRVIAFTGVIALLTAAAFGVGPALIDARRDLAAGVREGGRGSGETRARRRVRSALATAEIALASLLAIGAGLLVRTFAELQLVNEGFETRGVLTAFVSVPAAKYPTPEQRAAFAGAVLERVRALPQVTAASFISRLPLNPGASRSDITIAGRARQPDDPNPDYLTATPGYFASLGIPIVEGRDFDAHDALGSTPVAILSLATAKHFWPSESAIGKRVQIRDSLWREVVGVVSDVRQHLPEKAPIPAAYIPFAQDPWANATIVVRSAGDPATLTRALEREVRAVDPDQPLSSVRTMTEVVSRSLAERRFTLTLIGLFTAIALLLAAVGVYGVIAYGIAQRTREMGVRIALGALPADVVRLVVRDGLILAGAGVGAGLVASLALAPVLRSMLYAITPRDPATLVAVAITVGVVALLASWIPARRASRLDPEQALRSD